MSSGDHSHKKRTPSPNPHDLEHEVKRHKGGSDATSPTDSDRGHHGAARHKNGKKAGKDEEFESSIRSETSSQAIHGMDEKYMQELVETIYRLRMPKDFFDFWDFCCRTNPMNPRMALSGLNIELVGPFDILAGDVDHKPSNLLELQDLALLHWRYFYDVPEFQTVLKVSGSGSQLHYGYFRDDPGHLPVFVASNDAAKDCKIHEHGGNLFAAVHQLVLEAMKTSGKDDPSLKELEEVVRLHATKFKHTLGLAVDTRAHRPAVSSVAWHGAGVVARPESKETHSLEKKHHISPAGLLELLTEASNEEDIHEEVGQKRKLEAEEKLLSYAKELEKDVDAGILETTLEFGIALFCFGNRLFHKQARAHLIKAYGLLNRDLFAEISNKHVDARVRGDQLSKLPMK